MTCLIAGENYEEQLAPFQENNMGDCPEEYLDTYSYELETDKELDWLEFENESQAREHCEKVGVKFDPKNGSWSNSKAKWDWYSVGGRWNGYFTKKPDGYGKKGVAGFFGLPQDPDPNKVDIVRKGDIDIETMLAEYNKKAKEENKTENFLDIIRPFAIINNGEFIEKYDSKNWGNEFENWWESLSDDTIIVAIDYHM